MGNNSPTWKNWKDLVSSVQYRLDSGDDIHYDDLLIIRQDIINEGNIRKIALLSYWNDILWTRAFSQSMSDMWELAKHQIEEEMKRENFDEY